MGNLVDYAKDELKRIGMIDSGDPYNDWGAKAILDLIGIYSLSEERICVKTWMKIYN